MTSVRIAASVMAADSARLQDELRSVERAGVDMFHWIDRFFEAGADSISIHLESEGDLAADLTRIRSRKIKAGLAINPETPFNSISPHVFPLLDRILIMSVKPGFGGQDFIDVTSKISAAAALKHQFPALDIMVDGGINNDTAPRAIAAGATTLVSGSALFKGKFGSAK
jgi:ribulose-phosphate 3-epimerase